MSSPARTLALVEDDAITTVLAKARPLLGWIGFAAVRALLDEGSPALIRNASTNRLNYRPLGDSGEPYPAWVRDLRGKAGAYVIRDASSSEILYVGKSETSLYDTMTRHLQTWQRWKKWWHHEYSRGGQRHDPGTTYDRKRVEVAVRVTPSSLASDEEARLIHTLQPRDNLIVPLPF